MNALVKKPTFNKEAHDGYYKGPRLIHGATIRDIRDHFAEQIKLGNVRLEWNTSPDCERSVKLRMYFKTGFDEPAELSQEFFYTYDPKAEKWPNIIVLASQIGCSLECLFCRSSEIPMQAQLSPEQLMFVTDELMKKACRGRGIPEGESIRINFTGEGDPGANAKNVTTFFQHVRQLNQYIQRVMVSTAGILPGIAIFKEGLAGVPKGLVELQSSVHVIGKEDEMSQPEIKDTRRDDVIKKPKKVKVGKFLAASQDFAETAGTKGRINIAVMPGFNTLPQDAAAIAALPDEHFYVTVVPLNPTEITDELRAVVPPESLVCDAEDVRQFKKDIEQARAAKNPILIEAPTDRAAELFGGGCGQATSYVINSQPSAFGQKFAYLYN